MIDELTRLREELSECREDTGEIAQRSQEQDQEITRLREERDEARQAANCNKAAYTMAHERLTEYQERADAAEARVAELEGFQRRVIDSVATKEKQ